MNRAKQRILVVDDQTSIRRTMTGIIEDLGCSVVDAEDGYQAIESVKNMVFDLVFLDIKMPGINGIQTFREIKKLRPDSLVVMMTGYRVQESIDAAFDEGAMSVVYKPFYPERIIQILRSTDRTCPSDLPTSIGSLTGKIKREIDGIVDQSPFARVTVRIPDGELRALRLVAVSGPATLPTPALGSPASLGGLAFYDNQAQVVNNYEDHPLRSESGISLGIKSALTVPIRSDSGRILGSVAVACYESNHFVPEVVETFCQLANGIGNLMEAASPAEAESLHMLNGAGFRAEEALMGANR